MGLLIGIIRLRQLRLMQSNCEWKLQLIAQAVSTAQNSANNLLQVGTDERNNNDPAAVVAITKQIAETVVIHT